MSIEIPEKTMTEQKYLTLFKNWFEQALLHEKQADAVALATCGLDLVPNVRIVLLKNYSERGFVFYTNLKSTKAQELTHNPHATLCFYWPNLEKQIRISGKTELVTAQEADLYFSSRPRGSQIGAWASSQSQPLSSYEDLLKKNQDFDEKFAQQTVPRPPFWSGFRLIPHRIEFWEAGDSRLHKRMIFSRNENEWTEQLLYP